MRFPARFLALALLLAPLCGTVQAAPASNASKKPAASAAEKTAYVTWTSLDKAAKAAAAGKGRYIFVSVYTDWCGYCRKLNAVTYRAAPVVAELDKNFESVKLNAESNQAVVWKGKKITSRELATQWGVEGFPTLLFLNGKGEIVGSFQSYVEPDLMVKLLTYISSGARERKVTFDEYLGGKG
jgi:thioredoxin-related protein